MATVVLLGTLDTKSEEYRWVRDQLNEAGCEVLLINVGTFAHGAELADIGADEVARAAGTELDLLRDARDRGAAMDAMATGAAVVVRRLFE
ncbi:Tm-1-like ATP-binding domain-containing protein, partial [Microbispora rosea]